MKIRSQILLLLLLIIAFFVAGVNLIKHGEAEHVTRLTMQNAMDLNLAFDHYMEERCRTLKIFVSPEFRDWDELVTAVENRDASALQPLLDDNALRAYQAHAAWVLGPDLKQLYAWNNVPSKALSDPEFVQNLHPQLCASGSGGCHFYIMSPEGVMEVRGVGLHPGWLTPKDAAKAAPIGYFFAGRLLTNQDAREIGAITGNDVRLVPNASGEPGQMLEGVQRIDEPGDIRFERPLKGPGGQVAAWLRVSHASSIIPAFQQATEQLSLLLILFAGLVVVMLAAALSLLVSTPLLVITRSLHTRDLAALKPLSTRRSEIGELARLITDFHAQREQLVRQMDERLAAEHKLEESEEKLRQAQKMEAIGRLAGGVAHDFNNLLTAIVGYANMLATKVEADVETHRQAAIILQAGQQAAALTHQLLAFSRKQILQPRIIDANLLVANMESLMRRIIGENIDIRTELHAMHSCIKADPHQVEQVVLNLAVNARDAMPRGGRILLKTANKRLGEGEIVETAAGDYVVLEVADTGHGMDKGTIERIFEPFFTTKISGKGTGLGLATVYGIVRQSGGGIAVESEPGRGSTFRVYFPQSAETVDPLVEAVAGPEISGGGGTVLVVDDQKMVASLVGDVLKRQGYRVLVAGGPSEAIGFFRDHHVDLLITDVVMPRIDGRTLAEMVRTRHERVKILYISGYADSAAEGDSADSDGEFLFKPFTPDALAEKVRAMLGG